MFAIGRMSEKDYRVSFMFAPCDEIPLVDASLTHELFFPQGDEDSDALQREIWSDLTTGLIPDLQATLTRGRGADSLKSELHRIRGYCSTCALVRLGAFLQKWEMAPDPTAVAADYAPEAVAMARRSMREIELTYPHLVAQGG